MSPAPSASFSARRIPVQDRSERRVADLVAHAADVFAEVGYEATTMTEIALRAGASIGSVYQYFPNKEAITAALKEQYIKELEARWATLETRADLLSPKGLGEAIFDLFVEFADERPAFIPLLSAPARIVSDPAAKNRIRGQFARLFQKKNPKLSDTDAFRVANVVLQAIKGFKTLCAESPQKDRPFIIAEHRELIGAYLSSRMPSRPAKGVRS